MKVDGNSLLSKVASKDVQKVLPATNDASSGVKVQPLPTPEARSSIDSVSDTTEQVLQKGREEKKEEEVKPKHSKEKKKTKSGKSHVLKEGGNDHLMSCERFLPCNTLSCSKIKLRFWIIGCIVVTLVLVHLMSPLSLCLFCL